MLSRLGKALFTATIGVYFILVVFNNLTDYQTNFKFVQHVLSMDSIPANSSVQWRAIRSSTLHHTAYWIIILWEATAAYCCGVGAMRLLASLGSGERFEFAKRLPTAGLWLGLLLWSLAFITVGGEWFLMWQSETWNGELAALRMLTFNALVLLLLCLRDDTSRTKD